MLTIMIENLEGYFYAHQLMHIMLKIYGKRVRDENKFVGNINDVVICLICYVVEHRLGVIQVKDRFVSKFDYRVCSNTLYNMPDSQAVI